jgi:hypothetical protein
MPGEERICKISRFENSSITHLSVGNKISKRHPKVAETKVDEPPGRFEVARRRESAVQTREEEGWHRGSQKGVHSIQRVPNQWEYALRGQGEINERYWGW